MVQLLGFAGSALIIASITMRSVVRLRLIGLAGASTFVAYGVALGAWPVVITNTITTSIHLHHLHALRRCASEAQTGRRIGRRRDSHLSMSRDVGPESTTISVRHP